MNKNMDHAAMIEVLDAALLEQVKRWQSFVSAEDIAGDAGDVDWMEEFGLVVRNRLAKLQRQQVLAHACQLSGGRRRRRHVSTVPEHLKRYGLLARIRQ